MDIELIDEKCVAKLTGIRPSTLQFYRREGRGPIYIKIGRLVRYRRSDIEAWIEASSVGSEAAQLSNRVSEACHD